VIPSLCVRRHSAPQSESYGVCYGTSAAPRMYGASSPSSHMDLLNSAEALARATFKYPLPYCRSCEQEWLWRSLNEFTRRIHIRAYKHTYSYIHKTFFHSAEFGVSRTVQLCINVFMYVHVLYICMHVCGRIVSGQA
jgi:hypothetical protein